MFASSTLFQKWLEDSVTEQTDPALPPRPWQTPARGQPTRGQASRSQPLSRDAIVDAAMRILDQDGIDAVSMRRIAQDLDTGPSSLYAHVANKDELLELIIERISATIAIPAPDPQRWKAQLKQLAMDLYAALTAHADISRAALGNIPTGPQALRFSDGMLAIILAGGVPPQIAAWAIDRIFLYVNADAFEGTLYGAKQVPEGQTPEEHMHQFVGQLREYFAALPADRFPNISAHAKVLTTGDGQQRFEFGLDMLIDGLDRYIEC
jgi:AcrR family transcriptional regulator